MSNQMLSLNTTSSTIANDPLARIFNDIDFGLHSRSFHQLLTALAAIITISSIVIAAILMFRCYMLYCKSYANTTVYQLPTHRRVVHRGRPYRRRRKAFFWRRNSSQQDPDNREGYTFQAIFEDPST